MNVTAELIENKINIIEHKKKKVQKCNYLQKPVADSYCRLADKEIKRLLKLLKELI